MKNANAMKSSYSRFRSDSSRGGISKRADAGFWSPEDSKFIHDLMNSQKEFTMPEGQAAELLTQYFSPNVIDTATSGEKKHLWDGSRKGVRNYGKLYDTAASRAIGGVDGYLDSVNRMLSAQAPNVMPNGMTREAHKAWGSWDKLDEAFRKYVREPARKARAGKSRGSRMSSEDAVRFYVPDQHVRGFSMPGWLFDPTSTILLGRDANAAAIAHELGHSANRLGLLQHGNLVKGIKGGDAGDKLAREGAEGLSNYYMSTGEIVNPIAFMKRNVLMSGILPENGKAYTFKELLDNSEHLMHTGFYKGLYFEESNHTGGSPDNRSYSSDPHKGNDVGITELLRTYSELQKALRDAEASGDANRIKKAREMYEEFLRNGDAITQQVIASNGTGRSMGKNAGDDSAAATDPGEEHDSILNNLILGGGAKPSSDRTASYSPGAYGKYKTSTLNKEKLTPLEENMLKKDLVPLSVTTKQLRAAIPELDSLPPEEQEYLMRLARNTAKINRMKSTGKIFPDSGAKRATNQAGQIVTLRRQAWNRLEDSLYSGISLEKLSPAMKRLFKRLYPLRNSFVGNTQMRQGTGMPTGVSGMLGAQVPAAMETA